MKITLLILVLVLLFSPSVKAYQFAENWTWTDTAWQAAFVAVLAVDWRQTTYIAENPKQYYEQNPLLGQHPSTSEVNAYFAGCALVHTLISLALPPKLTWNGKVVKVFDIPVNPRRIWQSVWMGVEIGYVIHNANIGVKVEF